MKRKQTGRPKLDDADPTLRVGFTITTSRWEDVVKQAERENVPYSELIRTALEFYLYAIKSRRSL
jgi:hypothetical protein